MVSLFRLALFAILMVQTPQRFSVTVTDTDGDPVRDATITLTQGNTERTLTSGPDGTAQSLELALGEWTLTVKKDGFATKQRPVVVQGVPVSVTVSLDIATETLKVDVEDRLRIANDSLRLNSAATGGSFVDVPVRDLPATLTVITE